MTNAVWTFWYGSYMNLDVLKKLGLVPERYDVARLPGFDLVIGPRANLVRSEQHCVYGIVAPASHAELASLYTHAREALGEVYLPEPVLVETRGGAWRPALCYIAPEMKPGRPAADYVNLIATAAAAHDFPKWYVERIERFRP